MRCSDVTQAGHPCLNNSSGDSGKCGVHSQPVKRFGYSKRRPSVRRRMLVSASEFKSPAQIAEEIGESLTTVRSSCCVMDTDGVMESDAPMLTRGGDRRSPSAAPRKYRALVDMLPKDVDLIRDLADAYGLDALIRVARRPVDQEPGQ